MMELRTKVNIEKPPYRITYNDKVMFIGSCFATSMGAQLDAGRMQVLINPAGTVYNPVSVIKTLDTITSGKHFVKKDLRLFNGSWLSFSHYTDFSSEDPETTLDRINRKAEEARSFLAGARFLFVTFGTARIYRLKETGEIVSNCHRLPSDSFQRELLSAEDITGIWNKELDKLHDMYPGLRVVFTISPVRHWKDGAHGNQVSKSVLFLAVEKLLDHPSSPLYFPAYEIMMDDLRDYRFYADDMLHPSQLAIDYIWEAFREAYFDAQTVTLWNEASKIVKASKHRPGTGNPSRVAEFAGNMLKQISGLEQKNPDINLSAEKKYFESLLA